MLLGPGKIDTNGGRGVCVEVEVSGCKHDVDGSCSGDLFPDGWFRGKLEVLLFMSMMRVWIPGGFMLSRFFGVS